MAQIDDGVTTSSEDVASIDSLLDSAMATHPDTTTSADTPAEQPVEAAPDATNVESEGEAKPTLPTEPAAPAPVVPATPPVEIADPEVDGIENPRNLSPSNSKNISQLRSVAKERLSTIKTLESRVKELETKVQATPSIPEDVQKELESHRQFRRMFDLQNDQEFTSKYDGTITKNREAAYAILEKQGLPKEHLDIIKKQGFENVDQAIFEDEIIKPLMAGDLSMKKDAIALKKLLESNLGFMVEKENALKEASANGSKWIEEQKTKVEADRKHFDEVVTSRIGEVQSKIPWAKLQEVPPGAAPELKARVEKDNEFFNKYVVPVWTRAMDVKSPESRVDTAMAAVLAFKYSDELDKAHATILQLQSELDKGKAAGRTKSTAPIKTPVKTDSINNLLTMRDDDAIDAGIDAALSRMK